VSLFFVGMILGLLIGTWLEHREARKPGHYR
jgi:hypothetical protein